MQEKNRRKYQFNLFDEAIRLNSLTLLCKALIIRSNPKTYLNTFTKILSQKQAF